MAKILAITNDSERVYVALLNNGAADGARSAPIVSSRNTSEGIAAAIRNIKAKTGSNESDAAMALPDVDCILKTMDLGERTDRDLEMNLPYEFGEFIPTGSESNYAYDYQVLPHAKGEEIRLLCAAVQRKAIYQCTDVAQDAKLNLVRLAPETVALGDLIVKNGMDGKPCCIIDIGADTVLIRIYRGIECLASHEIMGGVAVIREALQSRNLGFFEGTREERRVVFDQQLCRDAAAGVAANIISALAYFLEQRILRPYTPIYLMGEGSLIPNLCENLSHGIGTECMNIAKLIPGRIEDEYAAVLAPAIGAAMLR